MKTIVSGIDISKVRVQSNVNKALDTTYFNPSTPRLIIVTVRCTNGATVNSKASVIVQYNTFTPPSAVKQIAGFYKGYVERDDFFIVSAVIPANNYYMLASNLAGTGTLTKVLWDEIDFSS